MAIERKDVRAKLDDDMHVALKAICDIDGVDMGEYIERIVVLAVEKRVHDATLLAERLHRAGFSGNARGVSGNARANTGAAGSRSK